MRHPCLGGILINSSRSAGLAWCHLGHPAPYNDGSLAEPANSTGGRTGSLPVTVIIAVYDPGSLGSSRTETLPLTIGALSFVPTESSSHLFSQCSSRSLFI